MGETLMMEMPMVEMPMETMPEEDVLQEGILQEAEDGTANRMELNFLSKSSNEGLARLAAAAFVAYLNPTMEELTDIKTAVTEAVTNAIIHGYGHENGIIFMNAWVEQHVLSIEVIDEGQGIVDIERAMEPLYTTRPDLERSGMGFAFMEAFMDEVKVESEPEKGTCVRMKKIIGKGRELWTTQSL